MRAAVRGTGSLPSARTPKEIVTLLNGETTAILAQPDTRERLDAVGFEPVGSTPEAFGAQLAAERASWRGVIQSAKVKLP